MNQHRGWRNLNPTWAMRANMGGKRKNMSRAKRKELKGRGAAGKVAVIGAKDRATNRITARPVRNVDGRTLRSFAEDSTTARATVYTAAAAGYRGMDRDHETVDHSVGEYVRDMAHTNGIESLEYSHCPGPGRLGQWLYSFAIGSTRQRLPGRRFRQ